METPQSNVFNLKQRSSNFWLGLCMLGEVIFYIFGSIIALYFFTNFIIASPKSALILFVALLPFWVYFIFRMLASLDKKYYADVEARVNQQQLTLNTIKKGYRIDEFDEAVFPWEKLVSYKMRDVRNNNTLTLVWSNGEKLCFIAGENRLFLNYLKTHFEAKQIKNWFDGSANT